MPMQFHISIVCQVYIYLAYVERKMDIEQGEQFVRKKLERSYNKLSDESKEIYKGKYEQVMAVFG